MILSDVARGAVCACLFLIFCDFRPAHGQQSQDRVVNVYGWSDYVDPSVLVDFAKATGVKVIYEGYNSDEAFEAQLQPGKGSFDVVIVSDRLLQKQIAAGLYLRLDKAKLPNARNLWPEVMARLAAYDPDNEHAVNYVWFTMGLAYNVEKAKELMGGGEADASAGALDSWRVLFKPEKLKKFSGCGVGILDRPEDFFAIARQYLWSDWKLALGLDRQTDVKRAVDLWSAVRRDARRLAPSGYADALARGEVCLAVGYSVDSLRARESAGKSKKGVEIDYFIPREGAPIFFDNLAIPKDAPHVEEAYAFIDFMLRPDIAARNTNFIHVANGVLESKSMVDADIAGNKSVYPDAALMRRLFVPNQHGGGPAMQAAIARERRWMKTARSDDRIGKP